MRAALLAVGVFAASYYPVRHGTEVKPYATDLLASILLTALGWAVASLYFVEFADWRPYVRGAGWAALGAIVIVPILHVLDAPYGPREDLSLTRGG